MNETQEEFIDGESGGFSYGGKDKLTFQFIILNHLKQICSLGCNEFRGGYINKKYLNVGGGSQVIEEYVPDSRAEYSQAVDILYDLLYPFFDKDMDKSDLKINQKISECKGNPNLIVKEKRSLFRALCSLLKRLDFLKEGAIV